MSKRLSTSFLCIACCLVALTAFAGCGGVHVESAPLLGDFDVALPDLSGLGEAATADFFYQGVDDDADAVMATLAASGVPITDSGWYPTLIDNFSPNEAFASNRGLDPRIWTTSVHGVRWASQDDDHPEYACYWCPDMVSVSSDGYAVIRSEYIADHDCEICNANGAVFGGTGAGRYTGGFETRREIVTEDGDGNALYNEDNDRPLTDYREDEYLFRQAFGYYETRVRLPRKEGMWSAFWLQSSYQRMVNGTGRDGTEIDVFESAFLRGNDDVHRMGHALLWDGYADGAQVSSHVFDLGDNDLYDGDFHTFGLLWAPDRYVFYVDGKPMWATADGGVAQVREFLRFTCEIDAGDEWGPHGEKIGAFDHDGGAGVFEIDYVRVYQNINWLQYVAEDVGDGSYSEKN